MVELAAVFTGAEETAFAGGVYMGVYGGNGGDSTTGQIVV